MGTFQGTRAAAPPEAGFAFFIAFFILFFVVIASKSAIAARRSCLLAKYCFRCMPVESLHFARRCP